MANKYELFLVDTARETKTKKQHPWYRERLRAKYMGDAVTMDARHWTFVNDKTDDFRPDHLHRHIKEPLLYKEKQTLGPILLSSKSPGQGSTKRPVEGQARHHTVADTAAMRRSSSGSASSGRAAEQVARPPVRQSQSTADKPAAAAGRNQLKPRLQRRNTSGVVLPTKAKGQKRVQDIEDQLLAMQLRPSWNLLEIKLTPEKLEEMTRVLRVDTVPRRLSDGSQVDELVTTSQTFLGDGDESVGIPCVQDAHGRYSLPETEALQNITIPPEMMPRKKPSTASGSSRPSSRPSSSRPESPGTLPRIDRLYREKQRIEQASYQPSRGDALFDVFKQKESGIRRATEDLCDWAVKMKGLYEEPVLSPEEVCEMFAEYKAEKERDSEEGLSVLQDSSLPADLMYGINRTQSSPPEKQHPTLEDKFLEHIAALRDGTPHSIPDRALPPLSARTLRDPCRHDEPPRQNVQYGAWYLPKRLWKPRRQGEELADPVEEAKLDAQQQHERDEEEVGTHTILMRLIAGDRIR